MFSMIILKFVFCFESNLGLKDTVHSSLDSLIWNVGPVRINLSRDCLKSKFLYCQYKVRRAVKVVLNVKPLSMEKVVWASTDLIIWLALAEKRDSAHFWMLGLVAFVALHMFFFFFFWQRFKGSNFSVYRSLWREDCTEWSLEPRCNLSSTTTYCLTKHFIL